MSENKSIYTTAEILALSILFGMMIALAFVILPPYGAENIYLTIICSFVGTIVLGVALLKDKEKEAEKHE